MRVKVFPAALNELDNVIAFVEQMLEEMGCSMKTVMTFDVCAEEMFVNVAHYAYPDGNGTAEITMYSEGDMAVFTISDSGIPFDPLARKDPDTTLSAEQRGVGGLGILMVKKSMDAVSYERRGERNIFTMKKHK